MYRMTSTIVGALLCFVTTSGYALEKISSGEMVTPESISKIPDSWVDLAGDYLVADAGASLGAGARVWRIPRLGGDPSIFAEVRLLHSGRTIDEAGGDSLAISATGLFPVGAGYPIDEYFLFGLSRDFDITNWGSPTWSLDMDGNATLLSAEPGSSASPFSAAQRFEGNSKVYITMPNFNRIDIAEPDGSRTEYANLPGGMPFGLVGEIDGISDRAFLVSEADAATSCVLITADRCGKIWRVVEPEGLDEPEITLWAEVPLLEGQVGLRQMAWEVVSTEVIPWSTWAYVSVASSYGEGGEKGSLLILDGNTGQLLWELKEDFFLGDGELANGFDPRGLLFDHDEARLLVVDIKNSVWSADPPDPDCDPDNPTTYCGDFGPPVRQLRGQNEPPAASIGEIQTPLECTQTDGVSVTLDGSGSSDPDGDTLTYTWDGPFGSLDGEVVTVTLPLGTHTIRLTVDDGNGNTDSDAVTLIVEDTTPPSIDVSLSPDTLWPPNHKMVPISVIVTVNDVCDENASKTLTNITMNEGEKTDTYDPDYDNGVVDGYTIDDIMVDEDGQISLRAERYATGGGVCTPSHTGQRTHLVIRLRQKRR